MTWRLTESSTPIRRLFELGEKEDVSVVVMKRGGPSEGVELGLRVGETYSDQLEQRVDLDTLLIENGLPPIVNLGQIVRSVAATPKEKYRYF